MSMACRFCYCTPGVIASTPLCYAVSLFFKDANALVHALQMIESTNIVIPGISARCEKCDSNSVISYCMYVYTYTEHAQIHSERRVDVTEYYNRIISEYVGLYGCVQTDHVNLLANMSDINTQQQEHDDAHSQCSYTKSKDTIKCEFDYEQQDDDAHLQCLYVKSPSDTKSKDTIKCEFDYEQQDDDAHLQCLYVKSPSDDFHVIENHCDLAGLVP